MKGDMLKATPSAQEMQTAGALRSEQAEGGDVVITPDLKLDKDKEGNQNPEDIRLMVEPWRKPASGVGAIR
jgi:hypothetical protein